MLNFKYKLVDRYFTPKMHRKIKRDPVKHDVYGVFQCYSVRMVRLF